MQYGRTSACARDLELLLPSPGGANTWDGSALGPPAEWPEFLKAFTSAVSKFKHPAAVYWGEEFVLLHNLAWKEASEIDEQGQPQRDALSADALKALNASLLGEMPSQFPSEDLLRVKANDTVNFTVLISPLFDQDAASPKGVLAQLIPVSPPQGNTSNREDDARTHKPDISSLLSDSGDHRSDDLPLDGHPFFRRFVDMLPIGLAILDQTARAVFVNQTFHYLTKHRDDDKSFTSWTQSIHDDDRDRVMENYHKAFDHQQQLRIEFRTHGQHPWRLLLLTPLGDENIQHVSLSEYGGYLCVLVDITSEKSAELSQRKAVTEANERKQQQERFIDMISHEIRNPLSAVLHCAEDIEDFVNASTKPEIDVDAIIDSVKTINLCVKHQRRIVDDVLAFSKLDSSMLALTPRPCRPAEGLASPLKMFSSEIRKYSCELDYQVDTSYMESNVGLVLADLSRISQVVINLVSNAIKFTKDKQDGRDRRIICMVAASMLRPKSYPPNVVFFDSEQHHYRLDATGRNEWGNGEALYIMFAVKDTGIGISDEAQKKLFERFKQATPKTSEIYGGSGLGLNISRKLIHLHGGEIGVMSKEKEGSTFGFFFRVRRAEGQSTDVGPERDAIGAERIVGHIEATGYAADRDPKSEHTLSHLDDLPAENRQKLESKKEAETQETNRGDRSAGISAKMPDNEPQRPADREYDQSQNERHSGRLKAGANYRFPELTDGLGRTIVQGLSQSNSAELMPSEGAQASQEYTSVRPHILLVEDNIINQRILLRKLGAKGYNVTTANDGQQAVEAFESALLYASGDMARIHCILMDQEMPVMDGNAATMKLRRLERERGIARTPILGVTANVRSEQQDEMLESGMDGVVNKPYKIGEIVQKIDKLLLQGCERAGLRDGRGE